MADKNSKSKKQMKSNTNREASRVRMLQILFIVFSIILILSMVLSLAINT
jgi:hypothetical protein